MAVQGVRRFENGMHSRLLTIDKSRRGYVENAFNNPREIGHFSVDAQKQMHYDRSQMKYYVSRSNKNLSLDLTVGYADAVREPFNVNAKLNQLLRWIVHSEFEPLDKFSIDFVCARGVIQKLLCTPFCPGYLDHWIICACRVGDVIYLKTIDSDERIEREMNATDEQKQMCAWGHKFEQYMTADQPGGTPDISSTTHEMEAFCIMVVNTIGTHNLLIRAVVDAVDTSDCEQVSRKPFRYVELKTSKLVPDFRSSFYLKKFKSLRWWAQSVVIGVEKNVCGVRHENGIVRSIETFKTRELASLGTDFWDADVCFNFCDNFLKYLKRHLTRSNPKIVYKFEYVGRREVSVTRLLNPEERYQVIPDWYLSELQKHDLY